MRMTSKLHFIPFVLILTLVSCAQSGSAELVRTIEEFDKVVATLQPGDRVTLANGTWTDVELRFKAEGQPDKPIELKAEEPGKVIITGRSNLAISGTHLVVSGLVFKDGFTPTSEVISFRTSKEELANNSRVTNSVIDNFSNPSDMTLIPGWLFTVRTTSSTITR